MPITYREEQRIDGNGQPYTVRVPVGQNDSAVSTSPVVAKTPAEIAAERSAATPAVGTNQPANLKDFISPDDLALRDAIAKRTAETQTASETPVLSEDEYKDQALRAMQGEIDAQNAVYAGKIAEAKVAGRGRLGSEGAIQARRGLLGSDFGAASTEDVNQMNTGIVNSIQDELNAKLSAIRTGARSSGAEKFAAATKARQEGADAYIANLQNKGKVNEGIAKDLATRLLESGVDISKVDPNYVDQLAKDAGITKDSIMKFYKELGDAQAAAKAKLAQDKLKSDADINKTISDTVKNKAETENVAKKFEEDKRQFGLTYALDQQKVALDAQRVDIEKQKNAATNPVADPQRATDQLNLIQGSLDRSKKLAHASGNVGVLGKAGRFFSGTDDYTNLVAETNTLRTNVLTMMTDPAIKKFFGPQMSNADVQLMTSAGSTLNPELQSPENLAIELERLQGLVIRAKQAVYQGQASLNAGGASKKIEYPVGSGKFFNVDANGDMTPAN